MLDNVISQFHFDETLEKLKTQKDSFHRALLHILIEQPSEGLRKFSWMYYSLLMRPMRYAAQIGNHTLSFKTALTYFFIMVVIFCTVDKTFGMNELTEIIDIIPVGGEFFVFLLLLVTATGLALAMHLALRAFGGKGAFKQTFLAQLILIVALAPIGIFVDAVAFLANPDWYHSMTLTPGSKAQQFLISAYYHPIYSVIHGVTKLRVGLALLCTIFSLIILFAGLGVLFN